MILKGGHSNWNSAFVKGHEWSYCFLLFFNFMYKRRHSYVGLFLHISISWHGIGLKLVSLFSNSIKSYLHSWNLERESSQVVHCQNKCNIWALKYILLSTSVLLSSSFRNDEELLSIQTERSLRSTNGRCQSMKLPKLKLKGGCILQSFAHQIPSPIDLPMILL